MLIYLAMNCQDNNQVSIERVEDNTDFKRTHIAYHDDACK